MVHDNDNYLGWNTANQLINYVKENVINLNQVLYQGCKLFFNPSTANIIFIGNNIRRWNCILKKKKIHSCLWAKEAVWCGTIYTWLRASHFQKIFTFLTLCRIWFSQYWFRLWLVAVWIFFTKIYFLAGSFTCPMQWGESSPGHLVVKELLQSLYDNV